MLTMLEIGQKATQAILFELATSPKPGLVDRRNSGAHLDMDYFTLSASVIALAPYFTQFAQIGATNIDRQPMELLDDLKRLGVEAEQAMFKMTGNVNTHKGAIFSIGLVSAAAGYLCKRDKVIASDSIGKIVSQMAVGICDREYYQLEQKQNLTKGEKIYAKYGLKGIRGEVEQGFPSVLKFSYPILKKCLINKVPFNESMLETYLYLLCIVDDTNVLGRHDMKMLQWLKGEAQKLIGTGGALKSGNLARLEYLDDQCIAKNVSPGGCADLLAVTAFIFFLEHPSWHYQVVY